MVLFFLSVRQLQQRKLSFFSGENANNLEFKELAVLLDKVDFFFKHYVKSLSLLSVFAKV